MAFDRKWELNKPQNMKQITQQAVSAFLNSQNFVKDNTTVRIYPDCVELRLHNNLIAKKNSEGIFISNAGWQTNTTKERLNAIPNVSICQKKGEWYLNGQKWDGSWIKI